MSGWSSEYKAKDGQRGNLQGWNNLGYPAGTMVKNPPINAGEAGDMSHILGSGSSPGEGNGMS